jgi:PST family polysaccharide transporter
VAAAAAALSPVWAAAWGAPAAGHLLRLFSLALLANTLAVVPLAVLRRNLRYRAAALAESTSQLAGMAIGVAAAFALRSPTALVLGQVAGSAVGFAWAAFAARSSLAPAFDRAAARSLLGFSTQVSGQNLVYFVIYTAPSWTVAHFYGTGELGLYSRAWVIVILPLTHLAFGLTKALYPLYPRVKGDAAATRELLTSTVGGAVASTWPAFGAVAGAAGLLVSTLLGAGWGRTAAVLPVLVAFGALNLPSVLLSNSAEAFGWMRFVWSNQAAWMAVLAVALLSAHWLGGTAIWVAGAAAASQALAHAAQLVYFARRGAIDGPRIARDYALGAGIAALAFAVARELDRIASGLSTAGRLPLEALVLAAVAFALPAARFRRRLLAEPAT